MLFSEHGTDIVEYTYILLMSAKLLVNIVRQSRICTFWLPVILFVTLVIHNILRVFYCFGDTCV